MHAHRSIAAVLGVAAVTASLAVTALWPRATFADGDPTTDGVTLDGTKVDDVIVIGELVKEPKSKTGWVVEIEAENRGTAEATADVETDITRQVMNIGARVGPLPTAVWKKKEKLTVGAGAKVVRRYEVPAPLAQKIAASAKAIENIEQLYARASAKTPPRITNYAVEFRGRWANEAWRNPENFSKNPFGDSMEMMMPPSPVPPPGGKTAAVDSFVF